MGMEDKVAPSVPKKRATVTQVDKKMDEVLEILDTIHNDINGYHQALKELVEALLDNKDPPPPKSDTDTMFS